jgi:hypothetical protein
MASPTKLPVIIHEGKKWYFDARLRQIRDVENPHDYQNIDDFEMTYFSGLANTPVRIVWKDEGRDDEGRALGRAYSENAAGDLVHGYDWITWKEANDAAERLGVELQEV